MALSRLKLPKAVQKNTGTRLSKGMPVAMDDGWRGKVESCDGETVVCIVNGERPNDYLRGYRSFSVRRVTISDSKAAVDWKSPATAFSVDQKPAPSPVVDLSRARREREWESAPEE